MNKDGYKLTEHRTNYRGLKYCLEEGINELCLFIRKVFFFLSGKYSYIKNYLAFARHIWRKVVNDREMEEKQLQIETLQERKLNFRF
jgi:hypothetical protein